MKFRKIKKDYFVFSKRERNASLLFIILIAGVILFPIVENTFYKDRSATNYSGISKQFTGTQLNNTEYVAEESVDDTDDEQNSNRRSEHTGEPEQELFYFDPNTISKEQWRQLGISENVAGRILNYRNKGGIFKQKEDLLKTYGFTQSDFERLKDYMVIEAPASEQQMQAGSDSVTTTEVIKQITEINSATADQLTALGFSSDIAYRIINFRNGLGGVYTIEQLNNIYGMDITMLNRLKPYLTADINKIQKLNINSSTFDQLAKHTYISDELARAIINYRETTGRFVSMSEIMKVNGMYQSLYEKLKPYLMI